MKNTIIFQEGQGQQDDRKYLLPSNGPGTISFKADGTPNFRPISAGFTAFDVLPSTTAAAGANQLLVSLGTSTEVIARSATGGVNVKSQASTPADDDNAMLIPVAGNAMFAPITAVARPRFRTLVKLTQINQLQFGAGLDENITTPIGSATTGDGAQFIFDPENELTLGAATKWIAAQKIAGADTYVNTGVTVVAGKYYELEIALGADKIPLYYINGALVATGAAALTGTSPIGAVIGLQCSGTPDTQKDFDCVYVAVERFIG